MNFDLIIGIVLGWIIGFPCGVFITALCVAAGRADHGKDDPE